MGQFLKSWDRRRSMYGVFVIPSGYLSGEGFTSTASWRLELTGQRWLSIVWDVAGSNEEPSSYQKRHTGVSHPSTDSESHVLQSSKLVLNFEPWQHFAGLASVSFVPDYGAKYRPHFHRGIRNMHSGDLDVKPENRSLQVGNTADNTIDTSAEEREMHVSVKIINGILSHKTWEKELEERNLPLTSLLVSEVIRRQTDANTAFSFFEWAKGRRGFQHTGHTYKSMLQRLMSHTGRKTRSVDTFELVMNEALDYGWSPGVTIHTYLINEYCKIGNMDAAFHHFRNMISSGCVPNVVTYTSLVSGLVKVNRLDEAVQLLDEMEAKSTHPNVVTYSIIIHGLIKNNQFSQAFGILDRMKKAGCSPNIVTYSILIDGGAKAGRFEMIVKLLAKMKESQCLPTIFIYGIAINYFVKVGKLQQAWDLFAELKEQGLVPNLFVFTPLMTSLGKVGDWPRARELLAEMESVNCEPDVVAYSALIAGLVKAEKWEEACLILDEMEAKKCDPNEITYTIIINGLVKAKQGEKAKQIFHQMVRKGISGNMYTEDILMKALNRECAL